MKTKIIITIALFIIMLSCKSYDMFLINILEDSEKSKIITDKGIIKYKEELEQKNEYVAEDADRVKKYFKTALELDKNNRQANEYIKKIDSLKQYFFDTMYKSALFYKNKKNKSGIDEYNMCFYVEKALEIDSSNSNALKLKKEIKATYEKLTKLYIEQGNELKNKINALKDNTKKEKLYITAYEIYYYANLLDDSNSTVTKELKNYESLISGMVSLKIKELSNKVKLKQYDYVFGSLNELDQNNKRSKNKFSREILDLKYQFYSNWGMDLYRNNKLQLSLYKLNAALSIKRDNYLNNIRARIVETLNTENFKNSFESALADIDEYIDNNELASAKYKIDSLAKSIKENGQKNELDARTKSILEKLPVLYESAVNDYNKENFKEAIKKFDTIYKVNPNYQEVKSYLEKAINKQKILENY